MFTAIEICHSEYEAIVVFNIPIKCHISTLPDYNKSKLAYECDMIIMSCLQCSLFGSKSLGLGAVYADHIGHINKPFVILLASDLVWTLAFTNPQNAIFIFIYFYFLQWQHVIKQLSAGSYCAQVV